MNSRDHTPPPAERPNDEQRPRRRPYAAPAIEEEEAIETLSLACSKSSPSPPFNCQGTLAD